MVTNYTSVLPTISQGNIESTHLGRPIHSSDGSIFAVTFVKEGTDPLHPLALRVVYARLCAKGIVANVVVVVVQCALDDLGGRLNEVSEFWGGEDYGSFLFRQIWAPQIL